MIEKTYRCDVCKRSLCAVDGGYRIRWTPSDNIDLCSLTDPAASETIVCHQCLNKLVAAFKEMP